MTDFYMLKNVKWTLCSNDISHVSEANLPPLLQFYAQKLLSDLVFVTSKCIS